MHEIGVAQGMLDRALKEAVDSGAARVTSMQIKLGDASGIEADHLRFCLEALVKGTAAETARIDIEELKGNNIYLHSLEVE